MAPRTEAGINGAISERLSAGSLSTIVRSQTSRKNNTFFAEGFSEVACSFLYFAVSGRIFQEAMRGGGV